MPPRICAWYGFRPNNVQIAVHTAYKTIAGDTLVAGPLRKVLVKLMNSLACIEGDATVAHESIVNHQALFYLCSLQFISLYGLADAFRSPHLTHLLTISSTPLTPSLLAWTSNHSRWLLPHASHSLLTLFSFSSRWISRSTLCA